MTPLWSAASLSILTLTGVILAIKHGFKVPDHSNADRILFFGIAVLAVFSIGIYTRFGSFNSYGRERQVFHYHDIFHYALGAKYFNELGYFRLYDCTYIALKDIGDQGTRVPEIKDIRSLENPSLSYPASQVYQMRQADCYARFGSTRWQEFKKDLGVWLNFGWNDQWWQVMLFDLGFNPPPSWNILVGWIAKVIPLSLTTLNLLPFLDMILLIPAAAYLIWRAFGKYPAAAYLVAFGTSYLAGYDWTGGSFARQIWLFFLIVAITELARNRMRSAGVFFALTAAMRIFPVIFFAGAVWALWRQIGGDEQKRQKLAVFIIWFLVAILLIWFASVAVFGPGRWYDFFQKITKHDSTFFVMHIGFRKFAVFSPAITNQNFWFADGLVRFNDWQNRLLKIYDAHKYLFGALQLLAVAAALYLSRKKPPFVAALVIGGTILFFFAMPANYYYMYLALFATVLTAQKENGQTALQSLLVFFLLGLIHLMPMTTADQLMYNGYINRLIFTFFGLLYVSLIPWEYWQKFVSFIKAEIKPHILRTQPLEESSV